MSNCVQSSDSSATVRVSLLINLVSASQHWCTHGLNWDFGDTTNTFCIFPSLPQCLLCFLKPTLYPWGVKAPHFILLIIHTSTVCVCVCVRGAVVRYTITYKWLRLSVDRGLAGPEDRSVCIRSEREPSNIRKWCQMPLKRKLGESEYFLWIHNVPVFQS